MSNALEPPDREGRVAGNAERVTLLVFSDDWGRHPSSCQHLVGRLLDRYDVLWVNTIGMRPPSFSLGTIRRAFEKVGQWVRPSRAAAGHDAAEGPTVLNPRMWPWVRRAFDRGLNRNLLLRQLRPVLATCEGPVVAVSTIPVVADLVGELPVDRWVYYCVDDFGQWPGLDGPSLSLMEERLTTGADVVVAAGRVLQERLQMWRKDVSLLEHGVDLAHWAGGESGDLDWPFAPPVATFWGLVDRRMDTAFLERLDARFPGTIVLVGPEDDPDPAIARLPRVQRYGAVDYARLPAVAARSDVLVMPYIDAAVTRAMQPLKLLEYLSTGRPVVVRDLPANRPWGDCLDLADDAEAFADLVVLRAVEGLPAEQRAARRRLASHDWSGKAVEFERLLVDGLRSATSVEPIS